MGELLDKNNTENTFVHIVMHGDTDNKKKEYECVGVLVKENDEIIRIAFSAKDDIIADYLDIKKTDIISITPLDIRTIGKM